MTVASAVATASEMEVLACSTLSAFQRTVTVG
jgi:hypothetical protein